MEQKFKSGDVVVLKSGGPQMTVAEYTQDGLVICEWFDKGSMQSHKFKEDQLKLYEYKSPFRVVSSIP